MARPGCFVHLEATFALRSGSVDVLRQMIVKYIDDLGPYGHGSGYDVRDVWVGLAPFHDCAIRLGTDPAPVFDAAAAHADPALRPDIETFGRRRDITLGAFGWRLAQARHGDFYIESDEFASPLVDHDLRALAASTEPEGHADER